jgi:hypothetical protein
MAEPVVPYDDIGEGVEKGIAVTVVIEDVGPCIAAGGNVINGEGEFYSKRSGHDGYGSKGSLYFENWHPPGLFGPAASSFSTSDSFLSCTPYCTVFSSLFLLLNENYYKRL